MSEYPMTPRETVSELDRYIVGQNQAKRAVAIALRNRWRRLQVPEELRDEIAPKNIIMIGPTGVGKTEISRRLAKLADAPFTKVEASRFTEVGYVGRDVESIIRDLVELAIAMVRDEESEKVQVAARKNAEDRVLDLLLLSTPSGGEGGPETSPESEEAREKLRKMLRAGDLDDREIEIETPQPKGAAMFEVITPQNLEDVGMNLKETLGSFLGGGQAGPGKDNRTRKSTVADALKMFAEEEAQSLIDMAKVAAEAIRRTEQHGIVFIDEIDKIAGRESQHGPDVSRQGVQRDLLPLVEGSSVKTRHGMVRTDHILFIAAGAFNLAKPSDLIPEFQGRFPIRVELEALGLEDFIRILTEPQNALTRQYKALLATENVEIDFEESAIREIARIAVEVNARSENVGARRLHTVMERILDEISFDAPEKSGARFRIDADYVREKLESILEDQDLSRYIL